MARYIGNLTSIIYSKTTPYDRGNRNQKQGMQRHNIAESKRKGERNKVIVYLKEKKVPRSPECL